MRRWASLWGTILLVLMLWAGGLAHAAERVDRSPATAEADGHYEGDGDQTPSDGDQGIAHQHAGCGGHQLAVPTEQTAIIADHSSAALPLARRGAGLHDHDPDGQLRPPMA